MHVDNGRVGGQAKKTLREIIEKYNLDVSITPNQNLILCGIDQAWREPITTALAQAGLLVRFPFSAITCLLGLHKILSILLALFAALIDNIVLVITVPHIIKLSHTGNSEKKKI